MWSGRLKIAMPACAALLFGAPAHVVADAGALDVGDGPPRPGDVLEGGYRIEREIGEGSTARVYAAVENETGRRVAIKWSRLDGREGPKTTQRLKREYAATTRIHHPNIIHVTGIGHDRGHVFLVMELLDGESLADRIERGPMEIAEAVRVLLPAMDGVAASHAAGVVHRDVKPENIFLLRDGTPEAPSIRVIDFGLSHAHRDDVDLHLTQPGTVLGTPLYMAPEQVSAPRGVDARIDVYAFGVVLYEMLTQKFPIIGDSYQDFLVRLATAAPMPLRRHRADVPRSLERIVMKAIARRPEHRYPDLPSLRAALEPFAVEGHDREPVVPPWRRWLWIGLAFAGLIGLAIALLARRR